jgi:mannose-6-phosphate isomerase-like protein (cupin superfamily)
VNEIRTSAADYVNETPRHLPLEVVDLDAEGGAVTESYRNQVLLQVNRHCLRMGVIDGQYPWHVHPRSDELFLVLEGRIEIDLADGRRLALTPHQSVTIPAGMVHRTRGVGRTVNLCVEEIAAETVFVEGPAGR